MEGVIFWRGPDMGKRSEVIASFLFSSHLQSWDVQRYLRTRGGRRYTGPVWYGPVWYGLDQGFLEATGHDAVHKARRTKGLELDGMEQRYLLTLACFSR